PRVLPRILAAMDTPDTVVANWLRLAYDEVAEPALKAGGKGLDAGALLAFARDTKRHPRARRLALETVERLRPGTRASLLRTALHAPAFRHDAVEQPVGEAERDRKLPKGKAIAALRKAFTASRDLAQSRALAAALKERGVAVSVADHMGFLRDW